MTVVGPGWWFGANDKDMEDVWVFDNGAAAPYTDWFSGMLGFIFGRPISPSHL